MKGILVLVIVLTTMTNGLCQNLMASSNTIQKNGVNGSVLNVSSIEVTSSTKINLPGERMMKTGRAMTIGGGVLFVSGIILMSNADELYYSSTSSSYGTEETGDPKGALGLVMTVSGVGLMVPGIILWSKGSKKYKAHVGGTTSFVLSKNGIGVNYNF